MSMSGQGALITGGGTGIGKAIARTFAADGAQVALCGRRPGPLEEVAEQIRGEGGDALALPGDVSVAEDAKRIVGEAVSHFGRLDILVNNAGRYVQKPTLDVTEEEWDSLFTVNVKGVWSMTKFAVEAFRKQGGGGTVLNIASTAGLIAVPGVGAYVTSKAAVIMMTKQLALELADDRVRVNCICPGVVETPLFETVMSTDEAAAFLSDVAPGFHPLGRIGRPDEIAAAARFLCSADADWVTGAILPVSGGAGIA